MQTYKHMHKYKCAKTYTDPHLHTHTHTHTYTTPSLYIYKSHLSWVHALFIPDYHLHIYEKTNSLAQREGKRINDKVEISCMHISQLFPTHKWPKRTASFSVLEKRCRFAFGLGIYVRLLLDGPFLGHISIFPFIALFIL